MPRPAEQLRSLHDLLQSFFQWRRAMGGQYALIEGQRDDATKLFEATAKDCPHGFLEGIAATAELKGLGQKVGAN